LIPPNWEIDYCYYLLHHSGNIVIVSV
jgi:hypothetical protein